MGDEAKTELLSLREEIDKIDIEMAELFCRRMSLAEKIAKCKQKYNLPLENKEREKELIAENLSHIENTEIKESYEEFLKKCIELSKKYQNKLMQKNSLR